jgi:hypothetical protein
LIITLAAVLQADGHDVLFCVCLCLRHRLLNVEAFRHANADPAALVADHDRDAETEAFASRNDAGHAAIIEHAFFEFFAHHRTIAIRPPIECSW